MDIVISAIAQRTGSTLVQRIFNARRQTLIWGEHGGIVAEFVRIGRLANHFAVYGREEKEAYFDSGENPNTWTANMSPGAERVDEAVVQAVRACFAAMYAEHRDGHDRIGFKEVRYGREEIELLKRCYPDTVIVLLVRHPVPIWRSENAFWSADAERFGRVWNVRAVEYSELHDPSRGIHLIRYEDIASRDERTVRLLTELAGVTRDDIENVLRVKLNSTGAERSDADVAAIRDLCQDGMRRHGYTA